MYNIMLIYIFVIIIISIIAGLYYIYATNTKKERYSLTCYGNLYTNKTENNNLIVSNLLDINILDTKYWLNRNNDLNFEYINEQTTNNIVLSNGNLIIKKTGIYNILVTFTMHIDDTKGGRFTPILKLNNKNDILTQTSITATTTTHDNITLILNHIITNKGETEYEIVLSAKDYIDSVQIMNDNKYNINANVNISLLEL